MSVKYIRWFFSSLLGLVALLSFSLPPMTIGASSSWTNGKYHFAGGTTPAALVLATLFAILYFALMVAVPPELGGALPGVIRRFFAFWMDFIIAMIIIGPLFGVLATIAEWRRTGVFVWMFERKTSAPTDIWLTMGGVSLMFVLLLLYFVLPLVRRRPSPGSCIAGYQVMPDAGRTLTIRRAILRTILGFCAVSMWPLTPFIARQRNKGKLWFDTPFSTHALFLR
jgi:hypothetical protein